MEIIILHLSVAQIATIISAILTAVQYTLGLAFILILVYIIPNVNSANTWTLITRELHQSLWPLLLRTESSKYATLRVAFFSKLSVVTYILIAIAGVITPLGLKVGPPISGPFKSMDASYVADFSPIGQATSPRVDYTYGRICGAFGPVPCPGNQGNGNTSEIQPSIIQTFNSTPYGPFDMQFRLYYKGFSGYNYTMTKAEIGTLDSLILQNKMFAIEGLIVDFTDNPGVGLLNHTVPQIKEGASWVQDVMWLEPVTSCVNTNLTIDYVITDSFGGAPNRFNLTDRGGFVNLTSKKPDLHRDGQNINLYEHSYKGAVFHNLFSMLALNNMTRNQSYVGKSFPLNKTDLAVTPGSMSSIVEGNILSNVTLDQEVDTGILCSGFGGADNANITNVAVQCGPFIGPPVRIDGGDPRIPSMNSTWQQSLYFCASTTKVNIQRVKFSMNKSADLGDLLVVSRKPIDSSVLWAVEKSDLNITDVDLFWGPVADTYESDPTLWTIRNHSFYVPAGSSDSWGVIAAGQPATVLGASWNAIYTNLIGPGDKLTDYSGKNNAALLGKYQALLSADPDTGFAQIRNLIWTDLVANNLVGSSKSNTLTVSISQPSVTYDLKYAIPLFVLLVIWLPSFLSAICILVFRAKTVSRLRNLLHHTSVGRIVAGYSALTVANHESNPPWNHRNGQSNTEIEDTIGRIPVIYMEGNQSFERKGLLQYTESSLNTPQAY